VQFTLEDSLTRLNREELQRLAVEAAAAEDEAEDEEEAVVELEESEEQVVVIEDVLDEPSVVVGAGAHVSPKVGGRTGSAKGSDLSEEEFLQGPAGSALRRSPLARSASSPGLLPAPVKRRRQQKPVQSSPQAVFDRKGQKWDERFQLMEGGENMGKPKQLRTYFSRPKSLPQLQQHFKEKGREVDAQRLEGVGREEDRISRPSGLISSDAVTPLLPHRHRIGGLPPDADGSAPVPWNDRWSSGVAMYNELLHPLHRAGFSRRSIFEVSPSQKWRRFNHVEVASGVWRKAQHGQPRFQPLGV